MMSDNVNIMLAFESTTKAVDEHPDYRVNFDFVQFR